MKCSICGKLPAWCVDKDDKGTYWLCGECAVDYYRDKIENERLLIRVARAAKDIEEWLTKNYSPLPHWVDGQPKLTHRLRKALKEAEAEHLL